MKQFDQFRKDIDEAAAAVAAIPKIAKLAKFAVPAAMTLVGGVGTYLQSRGNGESNFENLRKQQQAGEGEKLKKKSEEDAKKPSTREKIKNALVDAGLNYKKGLSVKPEDVKGKKYRTDDMKGESPAEYVRRIMKERLKAQAREYKRKQIKNKKIDRDLGK